MTSLRGWGFAQQHLAMDALVAFVDGELAPQAYDRAAAHLARCPHCAAEATAQRQARAAVRSAAAPSMSPRLLQALHAIPTEAELPATPDGLAISEQGQLVTVARADRAATALGSSPVLGSSTPLGANQQPLGSSTPLGATEADTAEDSAPTEKGTGRRTKQSASVVFSGLVLGTLALVNVPMEEQRVPVTDTPRPHLDDSAAHRDDPATSVPAASVDGTSVAIPLPAGPMRPSPLAHVTGSPLTPQPSASVFPTPSPTMVSTALR